MATKKPPRPSSTAYFATIEAAHERRAAMIRYLEVAPRTVQELAKIFQLKVSRIRSDMHTLMLEGWVVSEYVKHENPIGCAYTFALYSLKTAEVEADPDVSRTITTKWKSDAPAMFEPMAYLFGRVVPEAVC